MYTLFWLKRRAPPLPFATPHLAAPQEKAFDASGALTVPKALAVNKIGHALHDLDPTFRAFSRSQRVAALLRSLGYARPLPVQSMYICKVRPVAKGGLGRRRRRRRA